MQTLRVMTLSVALVFVSSMSVFAQNAASQARGDAHGNYQFEAHRLFTHQAHAQDYARIIHQQGQLKEGVSVEEAQDYVASIRKNIASANKALDKLAAAHPKDEAVKKSVEAIRKLHKNAISHCEMCEAECKKVAEADKAVIMKCCADMAKDLNAARAETEKLMKHLKIDHLPGLKAHHDDAAHSKDK